MYMLFLSSAEDGRLTLQEIIANIPHDAAAIFTYLLLAASLFLIWRGNRSKAQASDAADSESHATESRSVDTTSRLGEG